MTNPLDVVGAYCRLKVAKYTSRFVHTVNSMETLDDDKYSKYQKIKEED